MTIASGNTVAGITHHRSNVNGTELHYVAAGTSGSPILLVHGFPETWWTFRKLIPLLAAKLRVFAVDLRGFGDSANAPGDYDSKTVAEDLHHLIAELGGQVRSAQFNGVGHYVAMEAPEKLSKALLEFVASIKSE